MPLPAFETAPKAFRLHNISQLSTPAYGPLRAFPSWFRALNAKHRKLTADGWVDLPMLPGMRGPGTRGVLAAAADGAVFVDGRGALHKMTDAGGLQQLAPPWGGLIGLYSDEIRLVCDAGSDRVMLWEGAYRRTWVFSKGAWAQLDGPQPHAGQSLACPTPLGIYLLSGTHLWLLDDDRWQPVAEADADWRANLLWWPPRQDGLWALSDDSIEIWTAEGPRPVPGPPLPAVRRGSYYERAWDQVVSTGYDPVHNALLWYMEYRHLSAEHKICSVPEGKRTSVLWLDDCQLPAAALPRPRPGLFTGPPPGRKPADEELQRNSFYVAEFSFHHQFDDGFFYVTADRDQVRQVLDGQQPPSAADDIDQDSWPWRYMYLDDGLTVCVWTVQEGVLADGLDITPHLTILDGGGSGDHGFDDFDSPDDESPPRVALDWDAVSARLPALRPPVASPLNDGSGKHGAGPLNVRVVGPHPAPQIDTYLDFHIGEAVFKYGFNDL